MCEGGIVDVSDKEMGNTEFPGRIKRRGSQIRFRDAVKEDMQGLSVTEEDARD